MDFSHFRLVFNSNCKYTKMFGILNGDESTLVGFEFHCQPQFQWNLSTFPVPLFFLRFLSLPLPLAHIFVYSLTFALYPSSPLILAALSFSFFLAFALCIHWQSKRELICFSANRSVNRITNINGIWLHIVDFIYEMHSIEMANGKSSNSVGI